MPIYEYECPKCAKVIEVMQKFSDAPLAECPDCQGPVSKKVSKTSFQLKGTGWYATDYKKSPSTPAPVPSSTPAATSTTPAEAAAPKPAEASPAKKPGNSE